MAELATPYSNIYCCRLLLTKCHQRHLNDLNVIKTNIPELIVTFYSTAKNNIILTPTSLSVFFGRLQFFLVFFSSMLNISRL